MYQQQIPIEYEGDEENEQIERKQDQRPQPYGIAQHLEDNIDVLLAQASQQNEEEVNNEEQQILYHTSNTSCQSTSQDVYSTGEDAFDSNRGKLKLEAVIDHHLKPPYPYDPVIDEVTQQQLPFPSKEELKGVFFHMKIFNLEAFFEFH
jgi:hypothetical protein